MASDGASNNERLLAAARQDNEELLLEVFNEGNFDINFKDGLGNTALHYAVSQGSTDVLEHILEHEDCDVDPINRLEGATPLHLALKMRDLELRNYIVESLLEAGADTTIKDKDGDTAVDLLRPGDSELRTLMRKSQAGNSVSKGDIANDDDDADEGSGSESESD
ncbi:ankyrin repeat-containing domain protein [Phellopilus nigrolimitatus]|nr:ankyrin repeat-containing domain protein [Phellopilus nigrolimitatus]